MCGQHELYCILGGSYIPIGALKFESEIVSESQFSGADKRFSDNQTQEAFIRTCREIFSNIQHAACSIWTKEVNDVILSLPIRHGART